MVKVNFILRKRGQTNVVKKGRVAYPVYPILMRVSFNVSVSVFTYCHKKN